MGKLFARRITLRSPFTLTHLPFTARFHRAVVQRRSSRKAQLLIGAPLEKLFQLYYRGLPLRSVGELEYQSPGGARTIRFNARNLAFDMFYSELFAENYEDETAVLLDAFLPPDGCLYDIGSNWGFFSLYCASRSERLKIHAFEPIPSTFADLVSCVAQAGMSAQIQCHNLAVSDSEKEMEFQVPLHSAAAQSETEAPFDPSVRRVPVRTARLDELHLDRPDFIKIDAEGHEAAVLRGSHVLLRETKPFLMFENKLYRSSPEQTLDPLHSLIRLGYELFVPTVRRASGEAEYLENCGYQTDVGKMQIIKREDVLVLLPCDPALRFLLPAFLNLFACHRDRLSELHSRFDELPLKSIA